MNTSTTPGERSALAFEREYLAWYTRVNDEVGTAFDPSALVAQARAQYPHLPQVAEAFGRLPHDDGRTTLVQLCCKHARA
jgi:hypothetical protein